MLSRSVHGRPCHSAAQDLTATTVGKWGCKPERRELVERLDAD